MTIKFALICDYASVSQDGKLSTMGIFDTHSIPSVHGSMHLAFMFELHPAELGHQFKLKVKLVDDKGQSLMRTDREMKFEGAVESGHSVGAHACLL